MQTKPHPLFVEWLKAIDALQDHRADVKKNPPGRLRDHRRAVLSEGTVVLTTNTSDFSIVGIYVVSEESDLDFLDFLLVRDPERGCELLFAEDRETGAWVAGGEWIIRTAPNLLCLALTGYEKASILFVADPDRLFEVMQRHETCEQKAKDAEEAVKRQAIYPQKDGRYRTFHGVEVDVLGSGFLFVAPMISPLDGSPPYSLSSAKTTTLLGDKELSFAWLLASFEGGEDVA